MDEAERVARGLSKTQRAGLMLPTTSGDGKTRWLSQDAYRVCRGLWRKGLVDYSNMPARITAKGIAVRNHLGDTNG